MGYARKSMLQTYMHRKHRGEAASALFTLFVFIALIMALTNTNVSATAAAVNSAQYGYAYNYLASPQGFPASGLATDQSLAFVAMWVLSLILLAPVELMLRKK